ncbi:hypothetical protein [Catenulispora acidiphila]|nr:hypothetical protein [Catenulispora acidiphila]
MPDDRRCTGVNRDGSQCGRWARAGYETCVAHGEDGRRCTGRISGISHPEFAGERCRKGALPGQTVCAKHGGSAPQAKVAAARRIVEAELMEQAATLVGAPVDNPLTELANLAGRARAWMELLQGRVEKLLEDFDDAEERRDREGGNAKNRGIRYQAGAGEQLRAEVSLYERSMDRLGKFLADYGRLGIDERLAKITESQAERVIAAIDAALAHAGVTGKVATEAKQVAARRLRAV